MAHTDHFLTAAFSIDVFVLGAIELPISHTADNIKSHIHTIGNTWFSSRLIQQEPPERESHNKDVTAEQDTVTEWTDTLIDLTALNIYVTPDNAENINDAIKSCGLPHIFCFAHIINIAVQKGLKSVSTSVSRISRVTAHFHKSTLSARVSFYCL